MEVQAVMDAAREREARLMGSGISGGSGVSDASLRELREENERLRKEVADLKAVGEVARAVNSTLLIEEVLSNILRGIQRILGVERVMLGLVNLESGVEEVKMALGASGLTKRPGAWGISGDDPVWSWLHREHKALLVDSAAMEEQVPRFVGEAFPGEFLKVPMVVKEEIIGTIMVETPERGFDERELGLLQNLVEHAAVAIENGRLYFNVIRSQEQLDKAQLQLLEAEKLAAIGQLAVSINHEINNPLCTINMSAQLLKLELQDREPGVVPKLDSIEDAVRRIMEVTQRVSRMKRLAQTEYLPNQMMIDLK